MITWGNAMRLFSSIFFFCLLTASFSPVFAGSCAPNAQAVCQDQCPRNCNVDVCCAQMGGISYCDSSAGRYVCNNGYYSSCYCTRHAVMDLQLLPGCCLWQGGVFTVNELGVVLCNDGSISELCSLQPNTTPTVSVTPW